MVPVVCRPRRPLAADAARRVLGIGFGVPISAVLGLLLGFGVFHFFFSSLLFSSSFFLYLLPPLPPLLLLFLLLYVCVS